MTKKLDVNDVAPEFCLPDHQDVLVRLSDVLANKVAVVFFYPKDDTSGCTKEACTFRDVYRDFVALGAEVMGISRDRAASHSQFRNKHGLPYRLLTDSDGRVAHLYGVAPVLGFVPGRVTFVIDRKQVVRGRYESAIWMAAHAEHALSTVKSLYGIS